MLGALECAALAVLGPALPYAAEMTALRILEPAVFGVWMSLEPSIATAVGLLVLHQVPDVVQLVGVFLVVAASVGAERTRHISPSNDQPSRSPTQTPRRDRTSSQCTRA
ncbi:MAG TPA: EamA family transporter [Actinomycetes bacterium]|nr:EamA family transporter [Actinomycetes bacterium]